MSLHQFTEDMLCYPWYYKGEFMTRLINSINISDCDILEKQELIKLNNDLLSLDISIYNLIYINIGAKSTDYHGMLRQLPSFINEHDGVVLIFLIDMFEMIPEIINQYNFVLENGVYVYENLHIIIYNTFFPTYLDETAVNFTRNNIKEDFCGLRTDSKDKEFVSDFYNNLTNFVNRASGKVIIVSTATFSDDISTQISGNLQLEMFPELTDLIGIENYILLVWPYKSMYFYAYGTTNKISYVDGVLSECELVNKNNTYYSILYRMRTVRELAELENLKNYMS